MVVTAIILTPFSMISADPDLYFSYEDDQFIYQVNDGKAFIESLADDVEGDITIPDKITTSMGDFNVIAITGYLYSYDVSTLTLNKYLESITPSGFNLMGITDFYVPDDNDHFTSVDGVLFSKNMRTLVKYPSGKTDDSYTVPDSVSSVEAYSFEDSKIKSVTLNYGLVKIGAGAFVNAENLEHVNSNTQEDAFPSSVAMIGDHAFSGCEKLTTFELHEGIEIIGAGAFSRTAIERMGIPGSVSSIGDQAFFGCTKLKEFIPAATGNPYYMIEDGVLYGIDQNTKNIDTLAFYPGAKEADRFVIEDWVVKISSCAFSGCTTNLKEIVLSDKMTSIDSYAFYNCASLEKINLDNVTSIEDDAFADCTNLKDVQFSKKLFYIGDMAFQGTGIEKLNLTDGIVALGPMAFSFCDNLKEVTISESCKAEIPYYTFLNDYALTEITIEGYDVVFQEESLIVSGDEEYQATIDVYTKNGYSLPDNVTDEYTTLIVHEEGKGPYPYENLIGVAFCAILIIAILAFVREV